VTELVHLRQVAAALRSGPSFEKLNQFIADFDAGNLDPENENDARRALYFEGACTHHRGYGDIFVEGLKLGEWLTLLEKASKELRETFQLVRFSASESRNDPHAPMGRNLGFSQEELKILTKSSLPTYLHDPPDIQKGPFAKDWSSTLVFIAKFVLLPIAFVCFVLLLVD
jgi:hypothetical protein